MPGKPSAEENSFLIYNPGTEAAHTIIRLTGDVGDGLTIRNLTTAQRCMVTGLREDSLLEGACLELDSAMGQTRIVLGDEKTLAFPYHDAGYLMLAPCTPFVRSLTISCSEGSSTIASDGGFLPHMEGQYLYADGWQKIRQVLTPDKAILAQKVMVGGERVTPVVTMNEIEIVGENARLTRFEIEYLPRLM